MQQTTILPTKRTRSGNRASGAISAMRVPGRSKKTSSASSPFSRSGHGPRFPLRQTTRAGPPPTTRRRAMKAEVIVKAPGSGAWQELAYPLEAELEWLLVHGVAQEEIGEASSRDTA